MTDCTVVSIATNREDTWGHSGAKNSEGSEILPYLETVKLVCHIFLDAGNR